MLIQKLLLKYSGYLFAIFTLAAFIAFWPSYYSRISDESELRLHTHGSGMTLWCLLLIIQGFLASRNVKLHRWMGKVSYILVPYIVIATINLIHYQMQGLLQHNYMSLYALALIVNGILTFLILYTLAMLNRKTFASHGRYMLATIFPLFTPITDRLIYQFAPQMVALVPRIGRMPVVPFAGFILADVLLIILILLDIKNIRKRPEFLIAFLLLLIYHFSVLNFYKYGFWRDFGNWFTSMPFS